MLLHPPYSPDLSPCDFDLIPKMKEQFRGIRFRTVHRILQAIYFSTRNINRAGAATGILRFPHSWQRIVDNFSFAHSPNFPSLHLRHNLFSNPSVALPTSQLILQPFRCFTYVAVHSPTLLSLLIRHSSFSNPSVALPTSELILQPFRCFTYATVHSLTLPLLHLRHSSFSNPSVASPTSQLILQPFRCFTYVTAHSPTPLPLLLRHKIFT